MLIEAMRRRASDIHVEPTAQGYELRLRVDGLVETAQRHSAAAGRAMVNRLMVMAQLLTYRQDIPQEGRLAIPAPPGSTQPAEARLAVIPTAHGLRAVVRLPAELTAPRSLDALGLPSPIVAALRRYAAADAGMLIVTGPAGSGKTTTLYALLKLIADTHPGLSIITLEDPVERRLDGITQIEVSPFGELTYERALRSILRQDPQVLMLGEIRDAATAALAIQAALSGHRLLCTLHASDPAGAVGRLLDMGIAPYQLTSAVHGVLALRLIRRLASADGTARYAGRTPLAELAAMDPAWRQLILDRADADAMRRTAQRLTGYVPLRQAADDLVARGITDHAEVSRVLGPPETNPAAPTPSEESQMTRGHVHA